MFLGGMNHYMFYTNATIARIKAVQAGYEEWMIKDY